MMDRDDYAVTKRFIDLSNQADRKGIVLFSNFLNMNEINLLHQCKDELSTTFSLYGGYEGAERQMVSFQPDALYYTWEYPIVCLKYEPVNHRFADSINHRGVLGALMHLGIDRSLIGDILIQENDIYIFCCESIEEYILQEFYKVRHTQIKGQAFHPEEIEITLSYKDAQGNISSNRLDAFVSQACKLSRGKAAEYILGENVFINGKMISNHNRKLTAGDVISLRGYGKLRITEIGDLTRKGRIWVSYQWYQ